jgi:pimeloyl-ACP methyl ester carboxylesterase
MRFRGLFSLAVIFGIFSCVESVGKSGRDFFGLADQMLTVPTSSQNPGENRRPIILVPGWGWRITGLYVREESWERYIDWLVQDGYSRSDIYIVNYSYEKDLDTIKSEMIPQFQDILSQYSSDTQFDVMGHSLGAFTSLWTIMEGGFAARVKKFISLSGIPQGWDSWYCAAGVCGIADQELTPYQNPFVLNFLSHYATEVDQLEKCSLFSPQDGLVKPYDAGKWPDGINVDVPDMKHMATIWQQPFYEIMRENCYAN